MRDEVVILEQYLAPGSLLIWTAELALHAIVLTPRRAIWQLKAQNKKNRIVKVSLVRLPDKSVRLRTSPKISTAGYLILNHRGQRTIVGDKRLWRQP